MPKATKEKALATKIAAGLDTLDFNYAHFSLCMEEHGPAIHKNLFQLLLTMLNGWALDYSNGTIGEYDSMFAMCEMSHRMMRSLDAQ